MDAAVALLSIFAGAAALFLGSRWLVDGAVALALFYRVSRLLIGLTVVAIGTSSPETVLSVLTSLEGSNQLTLGNIIGANISNAALVLGIGSLLGPLTLNTGTIWREASFLLITGPLLVLLSLDGRLGLEDGIAMFAVLLIFFHTMYVNACRGDVCAVVEGGQMAADDVPPLRSMPRMVLLIAVGIALLTVGAQAIIEGATSLASAAGVGKDVIGLTLVALGTTVPEVAITITASRRGQSEVVIGNIVGTIVFNTLFVLGLSAVMAGIVTTGAVFWASVTIMVLTSTLVVILIASLRVTGRRVGVMMVTVFLSYLVMITLVGNLR